MTYGILSVFFSWLVILKLGFTLKAMAALLLTFTLLILTFIDIKKGLLPDAITLPFLWMGLILNMFGIFQTTSAAILGAMTGYLFLWLVYWIFKVITSKEGMGYGDFKLLAMLGAWLGWQALPFIVLFSSLLGSIFGLSMILFYKKDKNTPIPFGPFLACGGYLSLLYGSEIRMIVPL